MKKALVAVVVAVGVAADGGENSEFVDQQRHGPWQTSRLADTFDDSTLLWAASIKTGDPDNFLDNAQVSVRCTEEGSYTLVAFTGYIFDTLGSMFSRERPLRVRMRVDDNAIVTTTGKYPHTLTADQSVIASFIKQMKNGAEVRIRTDHGDEQHTFRMDLDGFTSAMTRLEAKCGGVADRELAWN